MRECFIQFLFVIDSLLLFS